MIYTTVGDVLTVTTVLFNFVATNISYLHVLSLGKCELEKSVQSRNSRMYATDKTMSSQLSLSQQVFVSVTPTFCAVNICAQYSTTVVLCKLSRELLSLHHKSLPLVVVPGIEYCG